MKNLRMRFDLFDGDGGDGIGAAASEFASSLGIDVSDLQGQSDDTATQVVYGKGGEDSPVGSDEPEQEPDTNPDEEFAQLIGKGGKYEQAYANRVQETIQNRFKNATDWEGVTSAYEQATAPLYMKYGLEVGDVEGLQKAIEADDDLYARLAEQDGVTTDKYRENVKLRLDAQRGREMQEEFAKERQRREMYAQWDAEADELKEAFPNFDLTTELQNPQFAALLDTGDFGVKDAFFACHAQDILEGNQEYTRKQAREDVAQKLASNARRPVENAMSHNPAVVRKADPSKLTDEDMDKIFEIVQNGGTVSF